MNLEKMNLYRDDLIYDIDAYLKRIVDSFGKFSIEEALILRTKAAIHRKNE